MSLKRALRRELEAFCPKARGSSILVELPEGMRPYEGLIEDLLYSCGARSVSFRLEPTYGACETVACEQMGFDIVLHVGHDAYPLRPLRTCGPTRVEYLPVRLRVEDVGVQNIQRIVEMLWVWLDGAKNVAIGYSTQYEYVAGEVSRQLRLRGLKVRLGLVLGCYFSGLEKMNVDAYIVLGGGFHALGLGLATHGERRVYSVVPEEGRVEDETQRIRRELQKRYWVAALARDAERWGLIQGGRWGQCRPVIGSLVSGLLLGAGKRVRVYTVRRMARHDLDSLTDPDAFVVLACPRLAVEDFDGYHRPVLAPGEVPYALGLAPRIRFPW